RHVAIMEGYSTSQNERKQVLAVDDLLDEFCKLHHFGFVSNVLTWSQQLEQLKCGSLRSGSTIGVNQSATLISGESTRNEWQSLTFRIWLVGQREITNF